MKARKYFKVLWSLRYSFPLLKLKPGMTKFESGDLSLIWTFCCFYRSCKDLPWPHLASLPGVLGLLAWGKSQAALDLEGDYLLSGLGQRQNIVAEQKHWFFCLGSLKRTLPCYQLLLPHLNITAHIASYKMRIPPPICLVIFKERFE